MGINFPNVPGPGSAIKSPTTQWTFNNGAWRTTQVGYALPFNYIVNPALQISQENGNNSSNVSGFFPADMWCSMYSGVPTYAARGLGAGEYSVSWTPSPAKGTIAAGDWIQMVQYIEGQRCVDLMWGTGSAKPIVVRFTASVNVAAGVGNYAFTVRNVPPTRSYIVPLTLTVASKTFEFVIPGCTDGTWAIDGNPGINIGFTTACGSSLFGATNAWQTGNLIGFTGISNLAANASAMGFSRIGMYADPNNTGRAPPWEIPMYRQDLFDCQRYWQKCIGAIGIGISNTTTHQRASMPNLAPMRIPAPATAIVGAMRAWDAAIVPNITGISTSYSNPYVNEFNFNSSAAQNLGRGVMLIDCNGSTIYIPHDARM